MHMIHELKIWPESYNLIVSGLKKFELRKDDRDPTFAIGDLLRLVEWDPLTKTYTGKELRVIVTYVMRPTLAFPGIAQGWCVLSISDPL